MKIYFDTSNFNALKYATRPLGKLSSLYILQLQLFCSISRSFSEVQGYTGVASDAL